MYTSDTFCDYIWNQSYFNVRNSLSKNSYQEFKIPKKDGIRTINYVPKDSYLWSLQHNLLIKHLEKQSLPVCAKGFVKGESYRSFLEEHVGSRFFMRIDLSDFFPSITSSMVKKALRPYISCSQQTEQEDLLDLISDIVTYNESLPQGACTSPAISNIVMARTDQRITKYCQRLDIKYTRYADDLLFSSESFDFSTNKWFLRKIKYILGSNNFKINYSKLKYGRDRIILNGYTISSRGLALSRKRLKDIRHIISASHNNIGLLEAGNEKDFIAAINDISLRHRDLKTKPFGSIFQLVQYFAGYRSFLISYLDPDSRERVFQKELRRLIRRIERAIQEIY